MPIAFGSAARGAVVRLTCPHCKEVQARARLPEHERYECRKCGKSFTKAEAAAPPRRAR